jgi:hypothetical protein
MCVDTRENKKGYVSARSLRRQCVLKSLSGNNLVNSVSRAIIVGQDGILRADWKSAPAPAPMGGFSTRLSLTSCPASWHGCFPESLFDPTAAYNQVAIIEHSGLPRSDGPLRLVEQDLNALRVARSEQRRKSGGVLVADFNLCSHRRF